MSVDIVTAVEPQQAFDSLVRCVGSILVSGAVACSLFIQSTNGMRVTCAASVRRPHYLP